MLKHEEWLWYSEQDMAAAKKLIEDNECVLLPAVFHCQQCIEKLLKAFLCYKDKKIIKTYDLVFLVRLCIKIDKGFEILFEIASELNPYTFLGRYPDSLPIIPDFDVIKASVQQTDEAFEFIKDKIR